MAVLELEGLTHRYGRTESLSGVSLSLEAGTVYALVGPNGAGKTTLLRIVAGLLRPSGGRARLLGHETRRLRREQRAMIGYVAEGQRLPDWMRLRDLESYLAPLYGSWDAQLAWELRQRFELDEGRRIGALSRGGRMKAALLCALAARPRVLLLDEPFTGMDVVVKDELVRGMFATSVGEDCTIVIASHDLVELEALADAVGYLKEGRLVVSEPMERLERFRRVELVLREAGSALPDLPGGRLSEERSGPRLTFIVSDPEGDVAGELRRRIPDALHIDVRPATLREVFVALTRAGAGADPDREVAA